MVSAGKLQSYSNGRSKFRKIGVLQPAQSIRVQLHAGQPPTTGVERTMIEQGIDLKYDKTYVLQMTYLMN